MDAYTPSGVSRRLRELENEGVLEVQYRKGHAYYRVRKMKVEPRQRVQQMADGTVRVTYV